MFHYFHLKPELPLLHSVGFQSAVVQYQPCIWVEMGGGTGLCRSLASSANAMWDWGLDEQKGGHADVCWVDSWRGGCSVSPAVAPSQLLQVVSPPKYGIFTLLWWVSGSHLEVECCTVLRSCVVSVWLSDEGVSQWG